MKHKNALMDWLRTASEADIAAAMTRIAESCDVGTPFRDFDGIWRPMTQAECFCPRCMKEARDG